MEKIWFFWQSNLIRQSHWTNDAIAAAAQGRKRWRWRPDKWFLKEHILLSNKALFNKCVTILENSPSNLTSTTSLFWALSPFWTPTGRRRRRRRTPRPKRRRRRRRWRRQRRRRRTKTSPTESVLKVGRSRKSSIGSFWTLKCGHIGGSWSLKGGERDEARAARRQKLPTGDQPLLDAVSGVDQVQFMDNNGEAADCFKISKC